MSRFGKIKNFFNKKKIDYKFKKAGGHRLNEESATVSGLNEYRLRVELSESALMRKKMNVKLVKQVKQNNDISQTVKEEKDKLMEAYEFRDRALIKEVQVEKPHQLAEKSKIRKKKLKKNSDFNFIPINEEQKQWVKEKNRQRKEKRQRERREKRNQDLLLLKLELENTERIIQAREAYDNWLKMDRKMNRSTNNRNDGNSSNNYEKYERQNLSDDAYEKWIQKKKKFPKLTVKGEEQQQQKKPQIITTVLTDSNQAKSNPDKRKKHSKRSKSAPRENYKVSSVKPKQSDENEEEMVQLVQRLRQEKLQEKERSKKRVNSGIVRMKEDTSCQTNSKKKNLEDDFQWVLDIPESPISDITDDLTVDESVTSRKINKITHEHPNPFAQ